MTKRAFLYGASVLASIAVAGTAHTQAAAATDQDTPPAASAASATPSADADRADAGLAEIIVTAQRRSESLQKTALTIEVLSPKAITSAGVTSAVQLTALAPTVQVNSSGPNTSVYIRGVGGFSSTANTNPAVPYYVDGVNVARSPSLASEFYDVDRIEVVKGPQGTLYGRNASGGAINVLTRRPVLGKVEGHADIEIGNYGNQNGEAAINVPLGDTVAIRASGQISEKGGYTSEGLGDDIHQAGRLKLLWQPNADVSLLLNGSYGHIGGRGAAVVPLNKFPGWYPWIDIADPRTQAFAVGNAFVPPPFYRGVRPEDPKQDLTFYNVSAQLDWTFGEVTLTVLPSYRHSKMVYAANVGVLLLNGLGIGAIPARPETSKATSVEARLSGDTGPLKWVAGAFFLNEDQFEQFWLNGGFAQSIASTADLGTLSYAGFAQATYAVAEKVRLIGGIRYTSDRRTMANGQSYVVSPVAFLGPPPAPAAACLFPAPTQPQCLVDTYDGRKTFRNVSWKGGAEVDVLQDSLLYATVSRGFKSGGFNNQSGEGAPGRALPYQPEILTSYEAGLKSRFLQNQLQINVSAFYWDYKGRQEPRLTNTAVPGVSNLAFYNAGQSEIYGGNVDIIARPWRGATFNASVEYAHSVYKDFLQSLVTAIYSPAAIGCPVVSQNPISTVVDCSGFETARTPKWSGGAGITQEIPLGSGTLVATGGLTFASARWVYIDFIPVERAKAYGKLDASLTYQEPGRSWSVTGFVRNITNAAIFTNGAAAGLSPLQQGNILPPRTYGGRLSFNF